MSTYTQLQARFTQLISFDGWNDSPVAPDPAALVSQGYVDFSWDTEYNTFEDTSVTTVINQAEYTLSGTDIIVIDSVAYSTDTILYPTTELQEQTKDPLWHLRSGGKPAYWMLTSKNTIRLVDKPSTGSITLTIRGKRVPTALSAGSDVPTFPGTWHEALALRGAILHGETYAQGESRNRLEDYRRQYNGMVAECRDWVARGRYGSIQRTVCLPSRPRRTA